jgi:hypothetical protein
MRNARYLFATLLALAPLLAAAQPREWHPHAFAPYRTPHWVFDDRFHHDHFYPSLGYSVSVLPEGHVALNFRGGRYFYHAGVWYQPSGVGYVIVRPPVGIVVPVLPPAYTTVWIGGIPYYYANDVYYVAAPGGYAVAEPPASAVATAPAPLAAAPTPAAGNWYYCDSTKSYYPYVAECKEGWRTVPATPPQAAAPQAK